VVLFGGGFDDNGTIINLNDTWIYDLASYETEGSFLSSPHEIGQGAILKTLNWIDETPMGTDVKFQIRTAQSEAGLFLKETLGPDGNNDTYYTISAGENISLDHIGDSWVQYKIYLTGTAEDSPTIHEVNINYNHLPGAPDITSPENDIWIVDNTPIFSWLHMDPDGNQGGFQVKIDDNAAFDSIDFDSGEQGSLSQFWQFPEGTNFSEIPDGTWYWMVRTRDNDGDWGPYSATYKFKLDSLNPSSTITSHSNNGFYNDINEISGTANDNGGSGIESVKLMIKKVADGQFWTGTSWEPSATWHMTTGTEVWVYDTGSITWESNNQYSLEVQACDEVQNQQIESQIIQISFDSGAPSISINPLLDGAYFTDLDTISGRANDHGGSGIDYIEILIMRNSDNKYWNGNSFTNEEHWELAIGSHGWSYNSKDVTWTSDTSYTVLARATDKVGNQEVMTEGISFMIDSNAPTKLLITINNGDTYTKDTNVILLLYAQDSGSRVEKMSFSSDGVIWSVWEDYSVTKSYSLNSGDGQKTIYFRVKDHGGNIGGPVFETITLDTYEPVLDSDSDGEPNYADTDDDNDGLSDFDEVILGTDPLLIDTDGDNYNDLEDAFPLDPTMHTKEISEPEEKTYDTYWFLMVPLIAIILLLVFLFVIWRNRKKGQELRINLLKKFK
jgi:hypothetical protein